MKYTKIKRAQIDLIESMWIELNQYHRDSTHQFRDYYDTNTFSKRKTVLLAKDELFILVAENGANLVGFCAASINLGIGEIDSLYLKPESRTQGFGGSMLRMATRWLTEQGLESARLSVGEGNEAVIEFYQKYGFKQRAIMLETSLNKSALE